MRENTSSSRRRGRRVLRVPRRGSRSRLRAVRDRTAPREAGLALRAGPPHPQRADLMPLLRVPIGPGHPAGRSDLATRKLDEGEPTPMRPSKSATGEPPGRIGGFLSIAQGVTSSVRRIGSCSNETLRSGRLRTGIRRIVLASPARWADDGGNKGRPWPCGCRESGSR